MSMCPTLAACFCLFQVANGLLTTEDIKLERINIQTESLIQRLAKCPGYPAAIKFGPVIGRRDLTFEIEIGVEKLTFLKTEFAKCDGFLSHSKDSDNVKRVRLNVMDFQITYLENKLFTCINGIPGRNPSDQHHISEINVDLELFLANETIKHFRTKLAAITCVEQTTTQTTTATTLGATTTDTYCHSFNATFNTLNTTGRNGPMSLGSYYEGKDQDNFTTLSNGIHYFSVPCSGTYRITAAGAASAYDFRNPIDYRGRGAIMAGTFLLIKGEIIKILVGQVGNYAPLPGVGGGGGTFVTYTNNTPIIIAGGGGGSTWSSKFTNRHWQCDGTMNQVGNPGFGGSVWPGGKDGHGATQADKGYSGGGGGGLLSDGRSGTDLGGSSGRGGEGGKAFIHGGVGGRGKINNADGGFGGGGGGEGSYDGGGGGGGYSGGASGDGFNGSCGGGGGSYNSGSIQFGQSGTNDGEGYVTIHKQ